MTYRELCKFATDKMSQAQIENASADAWLLMEAVFEINRSFFFVHGTEEAPEKLESRYLELLDQRCTHVPLTVFQSIPVDGIIIVTSPQDLVSMIVAKAVKMAQMMEVPIIGLVENYSYLSCPDCGKKIEVFGKSKVEEVAAEQGLKVLAKLPIDPDLAELCDLGRIEMFYQDGLDEAIEYITAQ